MNWSKTQIVAFEIDFRKRRFIEPFFINSTPNVINEKSSDLFPKIYKETFDNSWLNTRLDIFIIRCDLTRRTVCFLLLLIYSTLQSVLRYLLCLFNVVISAATTSSNHARSVNFTALLFESPFALMKACLYTVIWLKRRRRCQSFTTRANTC